MYSYQTVSTLAGDDTAAMTTARAFAAKGLLDLASKYIVNEALGFLPTLPWKPSASQWVGDFFVNATCRSVGQVIFADNPLSGIVIFVALLTDSTAREPALHGTWPLAAPCEEGGRPTFCVAVCTSRRRVFERDEISSSNVGPRSFPARAQVAPLRRAAKAQASACAGRRLAR